MTCSPWPLAWSCEHAPSEPAERIAQARALAELWLRQLTVYRVGSCSTTGHFEIPSSGGCVGPVLLNGAWSNRASGGACCQLRLTPGPVVSVETVRVSGTVLDPGAYRLYGDYLRRLDACFPSSTGCGVPAIVVEFTHGIPLGTDATPLPPYGLAAAVAMGVMTEQILNAMCGRACALPSRMTSIVRNNVTVNYGAPEEWLKRNRTGLPLVDDLLTVVNPSGLRRAPSVWSPDMPQRVG